MAIPPTDLLTRLSGGPSNADPRLSLGGAESATAFGSGTSNNLLDDLNGAQAQAGSVEYRAFYVHNSNASLTWSAVFFWIDVQTTSPSTDFDIGLASEAVGVPINQTLANETAVPTGVTFTRPTTKTVGLAIGNLGPGQYKGVWLRRTVNAGAAAINDSGSIRFEGDSPP